MSEIPLVSCALLAILLASGIVLCLLLALPSLKGAVGTKGKKQYWQPLHEVEFVTPFILKRVLSMVGKYFQSQRVDAIYLYGERVEKDHRYPRQFKFKYLRGSGQPYKVHRDLDFLDRYAGNYPTTVTYLWVSGSFTDPAAETDRLIGTPESGDLFSSGIHVQLVSSRDPVGQPSIKVWQNGETEVDDGVPALP